MSVGGKWVIALALLVAPAARAEERPAGAILCDVTSGHYRIHAPEDLNRHLFKQRGVLAGTWKLEDVYPHPEFGSFLSLVLADSDDVFSELTLRRCPVPGFACFKARTVADNNSTPLQVDGIIPQGNPSLFKLKRENARRWLLEIDGRGFQLDLPHDVTTFKLKCVGAKGWFSFEDPLVG